jgi:predicted lipoprotein
MNISINFRKSLLCCSLFLGLLGCGGGSDDPDPVETLDRKPILINWVDNIVIPSYDAFKTKFEVMAEKSEAFTGSPDEESLLAFRSAWVDAYLFWQRVELFEFGPADRQTLRSFFNIYPTDVVGIASNIDNPTANLAVPAAYARQGFPALDYLINGVGADDAAILAYYTADEKAAARLAYIDRLIGRMNTLLNTVINEWPQKREDFINSTGLDIGSSMGLVVNAYVLHYERFIRSGKIGIPSGAAVASAGVPHPEKLEAYYKKDISRDLAQNAHEAVINFFNGVGVLTQEEGPSFKSYLDALGLKDETSQKPYAQLFNEQFTLIESKLELLSADLYNQIETDNDKMKATHDEMQKMVRMLKVDMTSAMSITITYTDNDGD